MLVLAMATLLAGCAGDATVEPELAKELDARLDRDRSGYTIPAISAAVVLPDGAVWSGVSGTADKTSGRKVGADTVFAIGSITKTFVSALALELADDGELSLDDAISKWVPELHREKGSSASLRQLLQHRSGIYNYTDHPAFAAAKEHAGSTWGVRQLLRYVEDSYFPPGADYRYSNTNYALLGTAIERATGRPLEEQIRTRLLEPRDLQPIALQGGRSEFVDVAHGYTAANHELPHDDVSDGTSLVPNSNSARWAWAAGGMAANARSVAVWADALFGGRVLDDDSLREMIDTRDTPDWYEYGLGVMEAESASGSKKMLGHTGGIDGFQSHMWYLPGEDVTIVVLVNDDTSRSGNVVDNLLDTVLSYRSE